MPYNPFGTPSHPRSTEESESWIRQAKGRGDSIEGWKEFALVVFMISGIAFIFWSIVRLFL